MGAEAYPYQRWPRVSRDHVHLLRGALRALPWPAAPRRWLEADALLGTRVEIVPGVAELLAAHLVEDALEPPVCVLCFEYDAGARPLPLLCTLSPELAATLVDRVLGGDGVHTLVLGDELDDLSAGVLGYVAARVCASVGAPLRLRSVLAGGGAGAGAGAALEEIDRGPVLGWPLKLKLGGEHAGMLRVFIPESCARALALAPPAPTPVAAAHPVLGTLPWTLCAHAAQLVLRRHELEALAPGDVVVPQRCRLARDADGWHGELELHVPRSSGASFSCDARGHELRLKSLAATGNAAMTEGKRIETQALTTNASELARDAPVTLCLTLANFTLTLAELSALKPGEVLNTGRAIGEHALLSAGGHAIARGELCEIDGEIGLRVLELLR